MTVLFSIFQSRIVAQQRAGELNQKLNYQKPEEETQVTEEAFKIFEEELEITRLSTERSVEDRQQGECALCSRQRSIDVLSVR